MATQTTENGARERVVSTEQARQGETSGHVRWVLIVSLALAVVAGAVLWSVTFL
ncbi:MAG: hypothetical protein WDM86_08965 [Rhizomicrobium sp.]